MKEITLTAGEKAKVLAIRGDIKDRLSKLVADAHAAMKDIVCSCENNILSFTDDEDDENLCVTDCMGNVWLIDSITYDEAYNDFILIDEKKDEWNVWDGGNTIFGVFYAVVDEMQREGAL